MDSCPNCGRPEPPDEVVIRIRAPDGEVLRTVGRRLSELARDGDGDFPDEYGDDDG